MATITKSTQTNITAEPGMKEIIVIKEFDTDRELVFKGFTDPYLYVQWIGPKGLAIKIEKFEPRDGGSYRFLQKDKNEKVFAFHGVYHEVLFPVRIIRTIEYERLSTRGHVELDTSKFELLPGNRTKLTIQTVFQSIEDRDRMINSNFNKDVNEKFERLEELLSKNITSWDL